MENKKGSGIFLGVVSVATLIVAIIGATFAFFSANLASDESAINATAYEFNATMSVTQLYPTNGGSLIPINPSTIITGATAPNNTNLLYAINAATEKCIDKNGYQVCALYQIDFENGGTQSVNLTGVIKTISNDASTSGRAGAGAFENLTYVDVTGTAGLFQTNGSPITLDQTVGNTTNIGGVTVNAKSGETNGTATKYVLIYLNDIGESQPTEMGATYNGQLIFTSTVGDGARLTGTFTID